MTRTKTNFVTQQQLKTMRGGRGLGHTHPNKDILDKITEDMLSSHPYISLERLQEYLYRVTFDRLPEDNGGDNPQPAACSAYVKDGKLYRNLDFNYDDAASFIVQTRDFEGMSFITGLNDGAMDDELIAQLPYRIVDGANKYGIKVAVLVLFNDWDWTGTGERSISLTRLPYLILSRVKSMATISTDLAGVLDNLFASETLQATGYLLQVMVTDLTTTYAVIPPTREGRSYELMDITDCPKLTNFRPVGRDQVSRADSDIQDRPTGIERYNMMPCPLEDLRFTKAYESQDRLSEFIGIRDTTKDSTDAELLAIYRDARTEYLRRQRDGLTWQTMHSNVYGSRMEELYVQERWNLNCIGLEFGQLPDVFIAGTKAKPEESDEELRRITRLYFTAGTLTDESIDLEVVLVGGKRMLHTSLPFFSDEEVTAGGIGGDTPTPGSGTLGGLVNVVAEADNPQLTDKILVRRAGESVTHWTLVDLSSIGGGNVDDVLVSGVSVVTNKIANIALTWGNVQNKPAWIGDSKPAYTLAELTGDTTHRVVTDAQITSWNAKADASSLGNYLPLTGGRIRGNLSIYQTDSEPLPVLTIGRNFANLSAGDIIFQNGGRNGIKISGEYSAYAARQDLVFYSSNNSTSPYEPIWVEAMRISRAGAVTIGGNTAYHSGNCNNTSTPWSASSLTLAGAITGATQIDFNGKVTGEIGLEVITVNGQRVLHTTLPFCSDNEITAGGIGTGGGGGGGLIQTVYGYTDLGGTYSDSDKTNTFNAYTTARLAQRITALENAPAGGVTSFNTRTGAVTLASGDITTALGYTPANNASLATYLPLSGGEITGSIVMNGRGSDVPLIRNFTATASTGWQRSIISIKVDGVSKFYIGAYGNYTAGADDNGIRYAYIGCNAYGGLNLRITETSLEWGTNTIYHSGNLTKSTLGLGNIDNTADADKRVAYASSAGNADTFDGRHASYFATASSLGNYLPLTGGKLSGNVSILTAADVLPILRIGIAINQNKNAGEILFQNGTRNGFRIASETAGTAGRQDLVFYSSNNSTSPYEPIWVEAMRLSRTGAVTIGGNTAYHSGNANNASTPWSCSNLTASGNVTASGEVTAGASSDSRFKDNQIPLHNADAVLKSLRPMEFDWNDLYHSVGGRNEGHDVGFLAQDVQPLIPSAIGKVYGDYLRLDYSKVTPYLVAGWQMHETEIDCLRIRVAELEKRLNIN